MPLIDKPLPELRVYAGRNPAPPDLDRFWDASLAEMEAVDPRVELTPAAFQAPGAECFDLWFTGVGEARVYAKYLRPKALTGKVPAIIQFHGYSSNSGDWNDKLNYVGGAGFALAALDCRGQGGRSQDAGGGAGTTLRGHIIRGLDDPDPRKLAFRQILLDSAQLAKIVAGFPEIDANRLGAVGGSQGGALALACAALAPHLIKRAAPTFPFLCDYQRVWEMDLGETPYEELKYYFRYFDPTHAREEEIFTKLGYIDVQHLAKRIRGQVLMGTGLMDRICPPSTQFAAYNKITAPKDVLVYPDFGHEDLPGFRDAVFKFMCGL
jgi:cephalosporin-C deacetylase